MKLTVLGCAGSMSGPDSSASGFLVTAGSTAVTLDFGPGVMGRLLATHDPAALDAMVVTHLHADHMVDVIGMHVYRRWHPAGCLPTIPIYSPPAALERVRGVGGDGADEAYPEFEFRPVHDGTTVAVGELTLEFFAVEHTVEAYAVRVSGPSDLHAGTATLAYSGDTDACDGLVAAARGSDLFVCEAAFQEGRDTVRGVHLTGRRAAEAAAAAGAARLLVTHLQPWNDPEVTMAEVTAAYAGPAEVARAGAVLTL